MVVRNTNTAVRAALRVAPTMPRNHWTDACKRTGPENLGMTKPRFTVGVATSACSVFLRTGPLGLAAV